MNNKKMQRLLSAAMAVFMVLCTAFVSTGEVKASSSVKISVPDVMWAGADPEFTIYDDNNSSEKLTITGISSSNPAVAKTKLIKRDDSVFGFAKLKKGGTAKIKITYTNSKGKAGNVSKKIKVKTYPKEIKSLKINGKAVNVKKNKFFIQKKCKTTKPKIKLAVKKGWKIDGISANAIKRDTNGERIIKVTPKMLLNGKKFSFPKDCASMYVLITFVNKKGEHIYYDINLIR